MSASFIRLFGLWTRIILWKRILLMLGLGALFGTVLTGALGEAAADEFLTVYVKPVGDVFIRLIRMLIVPLLLSTLVSGVIAMGDIRRLGKIGSKAIALYLITTWFAVAIGILFALLLQPGRGMDLSDVVPVDSGLQAMSAGERLLGIIPVNPIAALANGDLLAIIFFSLFLGVGILLAGEKGAPLGRLFESAAEVCMKLAGVVMEMAPFGVFALIAHSVGTQGLTIFVQMLLLLVTLYAACITHILLVYGCLIRFLAGLSFRRFLQGFANATVVAYAISSSSATLPASLECTQRNLGVSRSIAAPVLSLGATVNMDGTAAYMGILAIFAAAVFGIDLTWVQLLGVGLTATLVSVGTAGIPSASLFLMVIVMSSIGVTEAQTALLIGLILPFDRLLDMMRTATNVTGDGAVAVTVAKWENEIDLAVYGQIPVAPPAATGVPR